MQSPQHNDFPSFVYTLALAFGEICCIALVNSAELIFGGKLITCSFRFIHEWSGQFYEALARQWLSRTIWYAHLSFIPRTRSILLGKVKVSFFGVIPLKCFRDGDSRNGLGRAQKTTSKPRTSFSIYAQRREINRRQKMLCLVLQGYCTRHFMGPSRCSNFFFQQKSSY